MEFVVMPDWMYGASVRVNGKWLGVVEEQPIKFQFPSQGEFSMLVELTPLRKDPTSDVYALSFARMIKIKDGDIIAPIEEVDGLLHIRKANHQFQLHFLYPKVDGLGGPMETLPRLMQTEMGDFDHDGRLDVAETFVTNLRGHVRIRLATGETLLQEVYPDREVRVEVVDLNKDGRMDVLIFWRAFNELDAENKWRMQFWDSADGGVSTFEGFSGVRRNGRGEVLLEKKQESPFRRVIQLYETRFTKGESMPQFVFVRTEEKTLQRAQTESEVLEAFFTSLTMGDTQGAALYLAKGLSLSQIQSLLGTVYAYEVTAHRGDMFDVSVFEWIVPGYYDRERRFQIQLMEEPDNASVWKIARVARR
jgi:hypothetical protein